MDKLILIWTNLKAIGFFPEITLVGMAVYFIMRMILNQEKKNALIAILVVNLLGQLYYDMPNSLQNGIGTIFFTIGQMAVAVAAYSMAEALRIIDYIKKYVDKRAGDVGVKNGG